MKKILITGASGFIGSFIVEEALSQGLETWAAVRSSSSRKYLQDKRIHFLELDFSSEDKLCEQLRGHEFHYIVHAAGATKCQDKNDFYRINAEGTAHFIKAIRSVKMPIEKFVFISSLSIFGAIKQQQPYAEITDTDIPEPNTYYGKSKLAAEELLKEYAGTIPYVILRPTGVYGPREKDYFIMAKSIKRHIDFAVGYQQQDITFVYVKDVVQAVFLAIKKGKSGKKYFLSDGRVYQSVTFSNIIRKELGNPWWIRITAPIFVLRVITFFGDIIGRITGKMSALNSDKYHILKQRNWQCDIQPAINDLGYRPNYDLIQGVKETIAWYKANKWL